jgi:transcriptional regulator with XRE-family HTH domain
MAEAARLIATIKKELKSQGLTYRDVARALRLSEASVKRMFASGRFSIDRLIELGGLLGLTLVELAHMASADVPRVSQLTEKQERALIADSSLLLVAVCALNHWTLPQIVATYSLSDAQCLKRLLHLDRLGLIALLPGNRIRATVTRDFDWLPNGPIQRFFSEQGQDDFLKGSDFAAADEAMAFVSAMLDDSSLALVRAELRLLRRKFAELHEACLALPFEQKRGVGLLMAMREWEPSAFRSLRR